ncbi:MAG: helix-turn-helix transcriptional regulator [Nitrospirae bacterium]|nr:helix-turn-helix transcriptional regulator [Nitrospirota bacterium]
MIRSEKQYEASKKQLVLLRQALTAKSQAQMPEALVRAARGQTAELAAEIEKQIKDYEELLKTPAKELRIHSLNDLRVAPIRYRIAARMTVESFARLVHVHSRQIARYESEDYQNVSWDTLLKILERLNVKIEGTVELDRKIAV